MCLQEDLTVSMLEKCKQSLPVVQRIAESTNDDESMLFEALNLHDELRQVISRCDELEASLVSGGQLTKVSESTAEVDSPVDASSLGEVNRETSLNGDTMKATSDGTQAESSMHTKTDHLNANPTKVDAAVHVSSQSGESKEEAPPQKPETTEPISDLKKPSSPQAGKLEN